MAGFPPIDRLYYDAPSLRLAGFLAYALKQTGDDVFDLVPGKGKFTTAEFRDFASLDELTVHLHKEHRTAYSYRGQISRHQAAYRGRGDALVEVFPQHQQLEFCLVPATSRLTANGWISSN